MADEEKKDRTRSQAQADAKEAITSGANKIVAKRQADGKWTLVISKP